jgi:hypothetical protein
VPLIPDPSGAHWEGGTAGSPTACKTAGLGLGAECRASSTSWNLLFFRGVRKRAPGSPTHPLAHPAASRAGSGSGKRERELYTCTCTALKKSEYQGLMSRVCLRRDLCHTHQGLISRVSSLLAAIRYLVALASFWARSARRVSRDVGLVRHQKAHVVSPLQLSQACATGGRVGKLGRSRGRQISGSSSLVSTDFGSSLGVELRSAIITQETPGNE